MDRQKLGRLGSAGLAAGLGAGLMYLLDPQGGGRRRAVARDKTVSALKKGGETARKTSRDLGNRTKGLVAEAGSKLRRGEVDDQVLRDRVRSKMGRVVSHPSAIEVTAEDGYVTLSGPVLAWEVDRLLVVVGKVKGVRDVENLLEVCESADDHPSLQGSGRTRGRNWSPTKRLLAGTAGGALALAGLKRRDKVGAAMSAIGLGLLAQGLTGVNAKALLRRGGNGAGRPSGDSLEYGSLGNVSPTEGSRDLPGEGLESALDQAEREFQTSLP
ncbi:MAG TPA: BON domain-containing protein [Thermoanaerobaculia bacterium]|jgi:hypothetical protein